MIDPAPGHVGDVQQAVDPAEVDEREVSDVLTSFPRTSPPGRPVAFFICFAAASMSFRREMTMLRRSSSS
jgi:hypothetical protein